MLREGRVARAMAGVTAVAVLAAGCGGGGGGADASPTTTDEPVAATTTTVAAAVPAPVPLGEADEPVVVGHRGASAYVTDNTIEGFEAAARLGADWVELDVRLSSDGVAVLSHDPETGDGSVVATTSAAELADQGLTTFADALSTIEALGVGVDVEVKGLPGEPGYDEGLAVADEAVAVLDEAGLTVPFVVSSFNPSILDRVRTLTGNAVATVRIFPAGGDAAVLAPQVVADGDDGVAVEFEGLTADDIGAYRAEDLPVWVWTVDDPADAERFVAAGAEAIITNEPDTIARALGV